mmetsp:Transcript_6564/g.18170  ORF Transcript_6564/g.18170 Transcript_6564/m.18170 type:complete len:573 (+) Transcript_6564:137-1855(+)
MLLFSSDVLTWTLTLFVILVAYILGAANSRGAPGVSGAGGIAEPRGPRANAASGEEDGGGEDADAEADAEADADADSLATVRTKTLADQSSVARVDGERAPQTPARSLTPSLGNLGKESEELSDDGDVEPRNKGRAHETVAVGAAELGQAGDGMGVHATAAGGEEGRLAQDEDEDEDAKVKIVRRKIVPKQHLEIAVVHYRDDKVVTAQGEKESFVGKGRKGIKMEPRKVERKNQASEAKGRKEQLAGASTPETTALLPATRMTPDGIPIVDVSRRSSMSNGSGGSVESVGLRGLTEKPKVAKVAKEARAARKGAGNTPTIRKTVLSRTTSNSSERERVCVMYNRQQGQQDSNLERQNSGRWSNPLNQASPLYAGSASGHVQGAPWGTSQATDTSHISTVSNISTGLSPSHRRNESENTKLEGAWMVASMAAAELGIGASDRPAERPEDRITALSNSDAVSPWQSSWVDSTGRPSSMLGGLSSSKPGSIDSLPPASTNCSNHDNANGGLDLYNSLSSLSSMNWGNSNSLSSYGSSLQRSTTSDAPDVFNTIKGIWGETKDPEKEARVDAGGS